MSDPVQDLLSYIDASPTPWHAVDETVRRLESAGYSRLDERDAWSLAPGDRIYVVRAGASLCAFEVGSKPVVEAGFRMVGAHTDSPNLRVKPRPHVKSAGMKQIAVEIYGGVLLHTWLDRDLSIAGRVFLDAGAGLEPRLLRFARPLARVPSLAIHLHRKVNEDGLRLNKQDHMAPLLALGEDVDLIDLVAEELSVERDAIRGWELCFFDTLPSARGGADNALIFAPRLDNLASCHAGLAALLASEGPVEATRGIALYDHEEVGSRSAQGADSPFLTDVLARLAAALGGGPDTLARALARSFLISADMAHALHPNYVSRHEPGHQPRLGEGPVIKVNANQRYATDAESSARFTQWCERADVKPQHFVTRSDLRCGSTIGPISAGRLGVRTIDIGNPMLSMHSCREMASALDVAPMIEVLRVFFESAD